MASGFDEADVFGTTPSATFFLLRKGRAKFVVKVPANPAETERSALRYRQLLNGMKTLDGDVRVITVKGFTRRNGTRVAPHARVIRVMRQEPFPAFGSPFGLLMPMYRNTLASCSRRLSPPQLLRVLREVRAQLRLMHARFLYHCDVKSDNIFLHGRNALLGDFGLCVSLDQASDVKDQHRLGNYGTLGYQCSELDIDAPKALAHVDFIGLAVSGLESCGLIAPTTEKRHSRVALLAASRKVHHERLRQSILGLLDCLRGSATLDAEYGDR